MTESTNPNLVDEQKLRALIDELSDQMCQAVDGRFDFTVRVEGQDETIEKLQMLMNFVLDAARRSLAQIEAKAHDLDAKTQTLSAVNLALEKEITERKYAQIALEESEAQIRAILQAAVDAIITITEQGIVTTFNRAAEHMFGYTADEVVGHNVSMLASSPDRERHDNYLRRYLRTGEARIIGSEREVEAVRKDGSTLPAILRISEMRHADQRWFIGILQDITDRKRAEAEREQMHTQLLATSRQAGMAEVATGVLHNVGNVLNSVNVTATLVTAMVQESKAPDLLQITQLLQQHADDLGSFITTDEKGRLIPTYLAELGSHLANEQGTMLEELKSLTSNIDHIKEIVSMQQSYAKVSGVEVAVSLADLVEDALRINSAGLDRHGAQVVREFQAIPDVIVDKQKVLQILVNLISNAKYALTTAELDDKTLTVRIATSNDQTECIRIDVIDNGVGIPPENLTRIFSHGFTTKQDGHGFGLHSCALAAQSIGGSLTVQSDGLNRGAAFSLHIPLKVTQVSR